MAQLLYGTYGPDQGYVDAWKTGSNKAFMHDPADQEWWRKAAQQEKTDLTNVWGGKDPFELALGNTSGVAAGGNGVANTGTNIPGATTPPGTTPTTTPNSPIGQPTPAPSTGQWWNQPYTPAPTPNTGGVFSVTSPTPSLTSGNSPITGGVNTQPAPGVPIMSKVGSPTGNMAGITTGMANTANKAVTTPGIAGGMQTMPGTNPTMDATTSGTTTAPKAPQIGVDAEGYLTLDGAPATGENAYGTSGQYLFNDMQGVGMENPDPRYYTSYGGYLDEPGNWVAKWGPNEETMAKLGGMIQLHQFGIGGYSEIKDPSKVVWHPEFGLLTPRDNINAADPGLRRRGLFAVGAIAGAGLAANAGLFGAEAATAGTAGTTGTAGTLGTSGLIPTAPLLPESVAGVAGGLTPTVTVNGLATGATGGGILGSGITGSQLLSGARTVMSGVGLANNLLNGGGGGSTNGGGSTLGNILTGALGTGATNHNLGKYEDRVDALINRSDPYGPYRQKGIEGLHKLVDNPGALASTPLFSAMQDKSDMNLQRVMAARGYLGSGNEMGALHENFSANLNKFYGEEFNRYARMAGIDMKPSTEAGIVSAGVAAATRQSRNAGIAAFVNSNGGLGGVFNLINSWLNSDGEQPLTDEQFDSWWNNFISSNDDVEFPTGDAGDYNG